MEENKGSSGGEKRESWKRKEGVVEENKGSSGREKGSSGREKRE